MFKRTLGGVGLFSMLALVLTSCRTSTGGGWIVSASDPNTKAHFGFNFHCEDDVNEHAVMSGSLEYHDQAYTFTTEDGNPQELSLHGLVSAVLPVECGDLEDFFEDTTGVYSGTYTPQPETLGPGGTFQLQVEDLSQQGPGEEDVLTLSLSGGVFDGYRNSGTLEGGQITIHLD